MTRIEPMLPAAVRIEGAPTRGRWLKLCAALLVALALVAAYLALRETGLLGTIIDEERLRGRIEELGAWGPLAVIALMILAILVSPIPSAPNAMAAGAAYGHGWGTLYVLIGAEAGALAAFSLAHQLRGRSHGAVGLALRACHACRNRACEFPPGSSRFRNGERRNGPVCVHGPGARPDHRDSGRGGAGAGSHAAATWDTRMRRT